MNSLSGHMPRKQRRAGSSSKPVQEPLSKLALLSQNKRSRRKPGEFGYLSVQNCLQILFRGGGGVNGEVLNQVRRHVGGQEGGQRGAEVDIFDTQMQQGQQDAHCLLLVPGQHQGQRQVIDAASEGLRQSNRHLDGAVGIVALTHVHDPGQAAEAA